jgi:hypothetical protein
MPNEVGHLPAGDPRRDLDHQDPTVRMGDQLWKADAVAQAESEQRALDELLGSRRCVLVERGRVRVDPADRKALAGRPQAIGERQLRDDAVANDRHRVHLDAVDELLDDHLPAV